MKKILSILAVLLCMAAIPKVFAYNFESGGIYYDITGSNTVAVTYATGSYNSYSGNVSIPSMVNNNGTHYTVTAIGNSAFRNCSNLTGVTIPGTVESIGEYAFGGCSQLTGVTIPNGVKTIEAWAFSGCNNLHSVSLPNTLTTIESYAFSGTGLFSVTIPSAVMSIGNSAFEYCESLTNVTFNADSCSFMSAPFCSYASSYSTCYNFHRLTIGSTVKHIPSNAFRNCLLDTLIIPASVKSIGYSAFNNCSQLDCLHLHEGLHTIGGFAFQHCRTLPSVTIPSTVDSIADGAFADCSGLTNFTVASSNTTYDSRNNCHAIIHTNSNKIVAGCQNTLIPTSVTAIGNYAFEGCSGLTGSLIIPEQITYIGAYAYSDCPQITSLTIASHVDTIGVLAFNACGSLNSVVFNAENCTYLHEYNNVAFFGCVALSSLTIGANVRVIPEYFFSGCSNLTGMLLLPERLKRIETEAFSGCSGLTGNLVIPDSVTHIGNSAFRGCSGITTLTIGKNVDTIESVAFVDCPAISSVTFNADSCAHMGYHVFCDNYYNSNSNTSITSLTIGDNVKVIPPNAFESLTQISGSLHLPNGLKQIGANAFDNCSNLTGTLVIPDSVTYIGRFAFYRCTGLTSIEFNADSCTYMGDSYASAFGYYNNEITTITTLVVGNNVKVIPPYAFHNLTHISGMLHLPDGLKQIGENAFNNCSGLIDTLVIPDSVIYIGNGAFSGCIGLSSIVFNADSCTTGSFTGCSNVSSLTIGDNVKVIPPYAFQNLTQITGMLFLPNSLKHIGNHAFYGCNGIDSVNIGEHVDSIGYHAFGNCSNLSFVKFNAKRCSFARFAFGESDSLTHLVFGNSVELIPPYTFYDCSGLSDTLVFPNSVKEIGERAFDGCSGLSSIVFGNNLVYIGSGAFYDCSGLTGTLIIPENVTFIESQVFANCSGLSGVVFGNSLKHIKSSAFINCSSLTGVLNIPDSVTIIEGSAFSGCSGLNSLILGRSVDSLGRLTFAGCTGLTSIISYATTAPYTDVTTSGSYGTFKNISRQTLLFVPCGSVSSYQNAWRYYGSYVGYSSYFINISEISAHRLTALSSNTLRGTVQVTSQATCTDPAVIEATPNFFYVFDHWSDGNTDNPRTITLTQDTTIVAHFREYTVTVVSNDTAAGAAYLTAQPTLENPQATVTAQTTDSCYVFAGWSNGSTENPLTISVSQDTTLTAIFNSVVNLQFSAPATVCQGDSAILVASGADSYLWFNGETSPVISILPENTLEVSVTGTNLNGCSTTKRHQIGVLPKPTLTLSGSTDICEGESTTITCSGTPQTIFFEGFENTLSSEWWNWGENGASWYSTIGTSIDAYEGERAYAHNGNGFNYLLSPTIHVPEDGLTLSWTAKQIREDGFNAAYYIYVNYVNNPSISNILYDYYYDNMLEEYWEERSIDLSDLAGQDIRLAFGQTYGDWNGFGTVIIDNIRLSGNPDFVWSDGYIGYQRSLNVDGIWQVSISDNNGCSTTDSVTVTVWQPDTTELTVSAPSSPYVLNSETFCTSGDYTQTLQNIHGCDSVVNLHLTVPSDTTVIYDTLCGGSKYIQQSYMSPEEYQQILTMLEYQYGNTIPFELSYDSITQIVTLKQVSISFYEQWETGYNEYGYPTYGSFDTTLYLNYNVWKDSAYYDNFSYTISYTSSSGCDSTVTRHRKIYFSDFAYYIVSACGRHIWQGDSLFGMNGNTGDYQIYHAGDTLTQSGDYAQAYTCKNGCDSIIYLHFEFIPASYEDISDTVCNSYTYNGITYTESGDYTFNTDTISVIVRELYYYGEWGYNDSDGNFIRFRPNGWSNLYDEYNYETDTYTYYYYDQNGVYHPYLGETILYNDTVPACKSVTLHLVVTQPTTGDTTAVACNSFTWHGNTYTQSGDYTYTVTSATGCDGVVTLHLTITQPTTGDTTAVACNSFTWHGNTYTQSGNYTHTMTNAAGCDSVVTLHLTITQPTAGDTTAVACESFTWHGTTYTQSGNYTHTMTNAAGCDSVVTLHLTLAPSNHTDLTVAACGEYVWMGSTYTTSGNYSVTYTNATGCDSIVTLHLTINPIPQVAITGNTTICPGGGTMLTATGADSYLWSNYSSNASIPVNMFGIYSVTGTTSAGCFNTATVTVLVAQPPVITITGNTDLCAGESTTLTANGGLTYMWSNGSTAANLTTSAAGSYQVIGYDENGCNSMASITVSVWQPATSNIYITSFDSCYTWFGSPYCQSGNYTHTLQTIHGCDSVITLHLTLEEAITNEYSATACNSYTWNGITYSQSGNYSQTFTAANGNDSIVTLHLTVNLSTNGDTTAVVCGSFEWHGNTYTQSGNYTYTTTNAAGCDSVVTLHLTIHQPTTGDTTAVVCESFSWHGNTYTQSGNYTHTMSNAAGCDSVVTLHLTVNQTVAVTDTRTVCASELPIVWNGVQFAGAGTQTATLQTVNGCDSVVTMTLTVNQPTTGDTTAVACETITWHGSTYTQSGNYTYTTTNVAGCDSVVTLHLTINQPTTGDTTAVACESFTWHGSTYTQSGDYTYTTTNVAGCDSVVTLHLTVNDNVTSEFSIVTEDSCYIWNGMSYCASGDYTQTLQTVHGCDSVVTLHLTITVGVDVYDGFDFRVYPNPTSTIVNVQFIMNNVQLEDAGMQVLDMYGKLVKVVPITGETTSINVSDLADGVYFVRLRTDAGTVTKRFVKN